VSLNPLTWIRIASQFESLWELEKKHLALINAQATEVQELKQAQVNEFRNLENRMTRLEERLEAREEVLLIKATSAAREASSAVASLHVSDLSGRLGRLEGRLRSDGGETGLFSQPRIPPPD
jgi:hypothetical protein